MSILDGKKRIALFHLNSARGKGLDSLSALILTLNKSIKEEDLHEESSFNLFSQL